MAGIFETLKYNFRISVTNDRTLGLQIKTGNRYSILKKGGIRRFLTPIVTIYYYTPILTCNYYYLFFI